MTFVFLSTVATAFPALTLCTKWLKQGRRDAFVQIQSGDNQPDRELAGQTAVLLPGRRAPSSLSRRARNYGRLVLQSERPSTLFYGKSTRSLDESYLECRQIPHPRNQKPSSEWTQVFHRRNKCVTRTSFDFWEEKKKKPAIFSFSYFRSFFSCLCTMGRIGGKKGRKCGIRGVLFAFEK